MSEDSKEVYTSDFQQGFEKEIESLINRHCMEGDSNTPDFILAQYLKGCLDVFNTAVQQRETWHGRDARPLHTRYGVELKNP
ncbi:MAG: hypothetical protein ABFS03_00835 [Chloroflexota bacterium]